MTGAPVGRAMPMTANRNEKQTVAWVTALKTPFKWINKGVDK
jgi:hypothetical protein